MSSNPPILFNYHNYAHYLQDYYKYTRKQHSRFSYRYMQEKTGVDPSYISKVFQGKKHLASASIPKFARLLKLNPQEEKYFSILINYAKTKNRDAKDVFLEKIKALKKSGQEKAPPTNQSNPAHQFPPAKAPDHHIPPAENLSTTLNLPLSSKSKKRAKELLDQFRIDLQKLSAGKASKQPVYTVTVSMTPGNHS